MKTSDLSLKFVCPVCGAQPKERCEMNSGAFRFESHRERKDRVRDCGSNRSVAITSGTCRKLLKKG
jgi:hypothetical protein